MSTYTTSNRHGYSVRFSPHDGKRVLVASSQLFGFAGGGTLFVLELDQSGSVVEARQLEWSDGLFDVVWSEQDESIAVSAAGDGSLQLWSLNDIQENHKPCLSFQGHQSEVYSIDWCKTRCDRKFLTASWDSTMKFWDPNYSEALGTFWGHSELIYSAIFSPFIPNIFSSVGTDSYLKFWSVNDAGKSPLMVIPAHAGEALTCDWSKFDQSLMATGGSDGVIRGWDLRYLRSSLFELAECDFAIRRLRFSPFAPSVVASAGYDFTTRIWDLHKSFSPIETLRHHTEFVCGLDWNPKIANQIADCGWDSLVQIFTPQSLKNS